MWDGALVLHWRDGRAWRQKDCVDSAVASPAVCGHGVAKVWAVLSASLGSDIGSATAGSVWP